MQRRKFLEVAAALLAATGLTPGGDLPASPLPAEPLPLEPISPEQLTAKVGPFPDPHEPPPIGLIDLKAPVALLHFFSGGLHWEGLGGSLHLLRSQPSYYFTDDPQDLDPAKRCHMFGRAVTTLSLNSLVMPTPACQAMGQSLANIFNAQQNQIRFQTLSQDYMLRRVVLTDIGSCVEANGMSVLSDLQFHAADVEPCNAWPANS